MLLTLYLCVLYGFLNKHGLSVYTTLTHWFWTIEVESVNCAVRNKSFQTHFVFKVLMCKTKFDTHTKQAKLHFCIFNLHALTQQTGRPNVLQNDSKHAPYQICSKLLLEMFRQCGSQILQLCYMLEGLPSYLYAVLLPCTLLTRHEHKLGFLHIYKTSITCLASQFLSVCCRDIYTLEASTTPSFKTCVPYATPQRAVK
jgi:hypothetical protein